MRLMRSDSSWYTFMIPLRPLIVRAQLNQSFGPKVSKPALTLASMHPDADVTGPAMGPMNTSSRATYDVAHWGSAADVIGLTAGPNRLRRQPPIAERGTPRGRRSRTRSTRRGGGRLVVIGAGGARCTSEQSLAGSGEVARRTERARNNYVPATLRPHLVLVGSTGG